MGLVRHKISGSNSPCPRTVLYLYPFTSRRVPKPCLSTSRSWKLRIDSLTSRIPRTSTVFPVTICVPKGGSS